MDYRDWTRGDDATAAPRRSRSSRSSSDHPRRTAGQRSGGRHAAPDPQPADDATDSPWDPIGRYESGGGPSGSSDPWPTGGWTQTDVTGELPAQRASGRRAARDQADTTGEFPAQRATGRRAARDHTDTTGEFPAQRATGRRAARDDTDEWRIAGHDDRPTYVGGRRSLWESARSAGDELEDTGSWRTDDTPRRRGSGHRASPDDEGLDTGQWERITDTGQYDQTTSTGEWDRLVGRQEDEAAQDKFDAFWSGHRLAGDDPRWMPTPTSAPRSPAVSYPEQRQPEPDAFDGGGSRRRDAYDGGRPTHDGERPETALARAAVPRALDATDPGWGTPVPPAPEPAVRQAPPPRAQARYGAAPRPAPAPARRPTRRRQEEFELDSEGGGSYLAAVLYAAAWYAVPVLVFGVWLMTLDGAAPPSCVSDVTGGGCDSPRAHALASLLAGVPQFGVALGLSLVAAVALRWLGHSWRAGSVGLAAAVVGGGLSTVLTSVLTGQPIG